MIIKSETDINSLRTGGKLLSSILDSLLKAVAPLVKTKDLDLLATKLIKETGGTPSFKTVSGYKWATCMSVNDEVVHGIPDDTLKTADLLCIDIGLLYKGFHTDMARTVIVGEKNENIPQGKLNSLTKFLETGKQALNSGLSCAKIGNRIGHISQAIQKIVEKNNYSVVKALVGHGIGRNLHEEPQIPGFLDRPLDKTPLIVDGMVLAIEVIYNQGKAEVVYKNDDGWTIASKDGSLSAVFEDTIIVTPSDPKIITR